MATEDETKPSDDIQQALEQAQQGSPSQPEGVELSASGESLAHSGTCPLLGLRYAMSKCGLMAERYPWQTTTALLLTAGCGWLCGYFGATVLGALVVYAVCSDE